MMLINTYHPEIFIPDPIKSTYSGATSITDGVFGFRVKDSLIHGFSNTLIRHQIQHSFQQPISQPIQHPIPHH